MSPYWPICWMFLVLAAACQLENTHDDPAAKQLPEFAEKYASTLKYLAGDSGQPLDSVTRSLTAGPDGPVLLQDIGLIETFARFNRERIPERVVHAQGAGAFGYFEVTHDITKYTKAKLFETIGKRTLIVVRFSSVVPERGGSDLTRNPRGIAIKFFTSEGIWDLVGNNTPIFFFRDSLLFSVFTHSQKRNPQTNLRDPNMVWDFFTSRPETIHQVMIQYGDRGIPDGYRHMHGFGSNTFKMVNKENVPVYVKFHYKTDQGIKNLSPEKAANISGTDPDYFSRDLYNAIHRKEFPSWTLYIQVMTFEQAEKFRWNPFDVTKVWPKPEFPLIPVGKIVLDRNPTNYFAEVEQTAFSPSNLVPGIETSPDPILQGRLFSYPDTQRYRLGPNYFQLPINAPLGVKCIVNYHRDGPQCFYNQGAAPNYYPNSFSSVQPVPSAAISVFNVTGDVKRYDKGNDDNFSQPAIFWNKVLTEEERNRMVENIANDVKHTTMAIQKRTKELCAKVSEDMGKRLAEKLGMK